MKSIVIKLMFLFFLIGIIAISITGIYAYFRAKDAILNRAKEQLTSIRVIKKSEIEFFFSQQLSKIEILSNLLQTHEIVEMLQYPELPVKNPSLLPDSTFLKNLIFAKLNNKKHYSFYTIQEGKLTPLNIIFFRHELEKLCNTVIVKDAPVLTDLILKNPSDTFAMMYLGKRMKLKTDESIILLLGISITEINNLMLEKSLENGLGTSGEAYLVGSDYLMRSNSRFICNSVLNTMVKTKSVINAFKNKTGTGIILDYRKINCLSSYSNIEIFNLKWAIIAEIDYEEAMIPLNNIRNDLFLISLILGFFILSIAALISGTISRPLIKLKNAAVKIGSGNYDIKLNTKQKDEIGMLADSIQEMSNKLISERNQRMSAIYDGQEIERQRISRELHDGLGQMMVALKFKLELLMNTCNDDSKKTLIDISKQLSNIIEETRHVSYDLAPSGINEFGLFTALKMLCQECKQSTGVDVEFTLSGDHISLSSKINNYLFRIVQEAISNSVRHSQAQNINVHLIQNINNLILIIEDNGKGFDYYDKKFVSGNGLFNMKERVRLLNGTIDIETTENNGTTIRIKIPINN